MQQRELQMKSQQIMKVTAWNNGSYSKSGSGYGLRISRQEDRDKYFKRECSPISLFLPEQQKPIKVNVDKNSFWKDRKACRELLSKEIGLWLIYKGYAKWPTNSPPEFELESEDFISFKLLS